MRQNRVTRCCIVFSGVDPRGSAATALIENRKSERSKMAVLKRSGNSNRAKGAIDQVIGVTHA